MKRILMVMLVLASFVSFGQKLKNRSDLDGLKIKVPKDFVFMPEEQLAQRYSTARKPTLAYTDADMQIDLVLNVTINTWGNNLEILKDFYKATILRIHKKVTFEQELVKEINKRPFIVFEFDSKIEGRKTLQGRTTKVEHYNYLMYTVVNRKIVSITFRCEKHMKDQWKEIATNMMNSVKIKDNLPMPETDKN